MSINYNISVVVPVYNSSKVLYELQERIHKALGGSYQLVFVDDYSQDDSWEVIKNIKDRFPATVVAVRMAKNFGQHNAIFCGLKYCTGDYIVTMDDDLQHLPEEIDLLVQEQQKSGADIVYGISDNYQKPVVRKAASRGMKTATRIFSKAIGEGSPFRLMKKDLGKKLSAHNQYFIFLDELISWYTSNVAFAKVTHEKSKVQRSRYSSSMLVTLYYELIIGYNAAPLRFITVMGLLSSMVSFLVGLFFIYKKVFHHVRVGYTGIIVSITFSAGIILLSIGIIGEHLRKMYNLLNSKPQYSVAEVLE